LLVCRQNPYTKTGFSQKQSSLERRSLLWTLRIKLHGLLKEPIIGPIKLKLAEICHLENREIAISEHEITRFR